MKALGRQILVESPSITCTFWEMKLIVWDFGLQKNIQKVPE